jgi:nitroreductase
MDLETAIRDRRSVRKFTAEPIPRETIRDLLDVARWSPSWANTQCWRIFVVVDDALDGIKAAFRTRLESKAERRFDLAPHRPDWPPYLRARTQRLLETRQSALGGDAAGPAPSSEDLFGAPSLILFAIDERLQPEYACFDTGLIVQTFCLAAHARGLGTCIMARVVAHADLLHEHLPEARGHRFVVGVVLGVPDREAPVNRFERERAALDELVSFRVGTSS